MRPVLIVQNNMGNKYSPTVIAAAITSSLEKNKLPTHIRLSDTELGRESIILMEQIRTIDKKPAGKVYGIGWRGHNGAGGRGTEDKPGV